jgi:opacity protein-like surface antigen
VSGRLFFALLLVVALASTSFAQTTPAFEGSFGYSFLRNFNNFNRHGWVGSAMGNVNDWLGIKGEVGGNYSDSISSDSHSFLAGPQITFRSTRLVTPWAHFLVGVQRNQTSFRILTFPGGTPFLATGTNSDFALQPGGGIDYWFQPHLGLRLGADYRRAFRENGGLNYFRLQAGIVFRFGTR